MKLRVAIVQINSILGEIEANANKVLGLLNKIPQSKEIDLVVLSELALTGYNFASPKHIRPYLDDNSVQTASTEFAQKVSQKYSCFTVIGLPQLVDDTVYNSCKLINPLGKEVYNYHKTFLYETDEVWGASENPQKSFEPVDVILNKEYYLNGCKNEANYDKTTINFGICMDLNPYKFEAPFNAYEFAMACYRNQANLIICPMAWLSPYSPSLDKNSPQSQRQEVAEAMSHRFFSEPHHQINLSSHDDQAFEHKTSFVPQLPDFSTVNYHILRFFPLMNHTHNDLPKQPKVTVLTCNRVGIESDILYGGSSSIFQFLDVPGDDSIDYKNPAVDLKGYLSQGFEGVLYRELDI